MRGRRDGVIAGLPFMTGMRPSEVTALHCTVVDDATDGDSVLVTVRRSMTKKDGGRAVRYVKNGAACAIRTLRVATSPEPGDCVVPLSAQMIGLQFTAEAEAAGA